MINPALYGIKGRWRREAFSLSAAGDGSTHAGPDSTVSGALKLQAHEPCLLLERRSTWGKDQVTTYTRLYHPGSRYRLKDQFTRA